MKEYTKGGDPYGGNGAHCPGGWVSDSDWEAGYGRYWEASPGWYGGGGGGGMKDHRFPSDSLQKAPSGGGGVCYIRVRR